MGKTLNNPNIKYMEHQWSLKTPNNVWCLFHQFCLHQVSSGAYWAPALIYLLIKTVMLKDAWTPTEKPLPATSLVVQRLVLHTSITGAWVPSLVGELKSCRQPGMGVGWGGVPFQLTSRKTFPGQLSSQASCSSLFLALLTPSKTKRPFLPDLSKPSRSYKWSTLHNALPSQ